jgi:hypothetical protein
MKAILLMILVNFSPNKPLEIPEPTYIDKPQPSYYWNYRPNYNTQYLVCHNRSNLMIFDREWHVHYLHGDYKGMCTR